MVQGTKALYKGKKLEFSQHTDLAWMFCFEACVVDLILASLLMMEERQPNFYVPVRFRRITSGCTVVSKAALNSIVTPIYYTIV